MRKLLLLLATLSLSLAAATAQIQISGKLTDAEDGQPLAFANIVVKGTAIGVITDANGAYSIKAPESGSRILVFSFVGYETKEVAYNKDTKVLNVKLNKDALTIDDIVVTGFGDVKKQTFTGSSSKIRTEDMQLAGITDPSRLLEGQVAGVSIQNVSSTFGSAPKVRVRGVTSISGENKPLWVVDGVILEDIVNISNDQLSSGDPTTMLGSSVAGINANDIETFDILKDAAATALYGARAMNGVIVITTKKGKLGAPRVTYNGNFTMRTKPRYDNYDIMNSADQMGVYVELARKGWIDQGIVNKSNSGVYGLMYNAINTYRPLTDDFALTNTLEARRAFLQKYATANTDWFDELFVSTLVQEHNISFSSGTEQTRTYASVGFMHDAGLTIADRVNRYTFKFNHDYDISQKVSVSIQSTASYREQEAPGTYSRTVDMVSGNWSRDFDINPFSYALNTSRTLRPYDDEGNLEYITMNFAPFNIINELNNNKIELNVADIALKGDLNYKIAKGLKYTFTGAIRYNGTKQNHKITEYSNAANAWRSMNNATIREANPLLWRNPDDPGGEKISVLPLGGFFNTNHHSMVNYEVRNSLSYNLIQECNGHLHEFSAMGGVQIKAIDRNYDERLGPGYQYAFGGQVYLDPNFYRNAEEKQTKLFLNEDYFDRFAAFYATADYAFDRKYSVSGTVRYEGSNRMGKSRQARWLPTWNFGVKWNLGEENFIKDNFSTIDAMSVRLSYGLSGSMAQNTNSAAVFFNTQVYRPGGFTENMIYINSLANSDLTWEKNYQFNVGYDLSMYRNRLTFSVDYFTKKAFDLIASIKTSGIGGVDLWKLANYADLDSQGIDFTIGGTPVKTRDWTVSTNFVIGWSKNIIKNAVNMPQIYDLVKVEGGNINGYPVNSLFSIPYVGLDPTSGVPLFIDETGMISTAVNMQSIESSYLKYEGQVDPKYSGGFNTTVRWKNLSASIFFSFAGGNVVRLTPAYKDSYSDLDAMSQEFQQRWMMSGDELYTNIPSIMDPVVHRYVIGYPYTNYNYSDMRVAKGDFIRLKSVSIGYDIPSNLVSRTRIFRSASLRVTGRDLWLLYSDKALHGQDPEFFNTGGVAMPAQTQVIVSLNLGF